REKVVGRGIVGGAVDDQRGRGEAVFEDLQAGPRPPLGGQRTGLALGRLANPGTCGHGKSPHQEAGYDPITKPSAPARRPGPWAILPWIFRATTAGVLCKRLAKRPPNPTG